MVIAQVILPAAALPALSDFYAGRLGLSQESSTVASLTFRIGASRLTFEQSAAPSPYHFAFSLPAAKFKAAKAWLAARRQIIADNEGRDQFEFRDWNARAFYFRDPAGNIVEFIARPAWPEPPDEAFIACDLSGICEIGLATDDVPAVVGRLETALGLRVYDGAGSHTFTAVRAETGLFIVVRRGRTWYPDTGAPATLQPLIVRLADGRAVRQTRTALEIEPMGGR